MPPPTHLPTAPKRVSYFHDIDIGAYSFSDDTPLTISTASGEKKHKIDSGNTHPHPMKPFRITLTNELVVQFGLYGLMEVLRAQPATFTELTQYHSDEYIEFLQNLGERECWDSKDLGEKLAAYNLTTDNPPPSFEYCSKIAGASIEAAARLNSKLCDVAIHWAGGSGLHAKRQSAGGFGYVNDVVLAILELLRVHDRVLFVDLDVHHCDAVEEAFYSTDRVMTVSLHRGGEVFPGTGKMLDRGVGKGFGYAVNVPLKDGIDDESYVKGLFEPILGYILQWYKPSAIVVVAGTGSIAGDRVGNFNLSMQGHGQCLSYLNSTNLPLLVLGGGGYTLRNVAKTWTYETGLLVGVDLCNAPIPLNPYMEYFGPEYLLNVLPKFMEDGNAVEGYLGRVRERVLEQLRFLESVGNVVEMKKGGKGRSRSRSRSKSPNRLTTTKPTHPIPETEPKEDEIMFDIASIRKDMEYKTDGIEVLAERIYRKPFVKSVRYHLKE